MANVLKMVLQQAIVALWQRGWSFRRIADELGVLYVLEASPHVNSQPQSQRRISSLRHWCATIEEQHGQCASPALASVASTKLSHRASRP